MVFPHWNPEHTSPEHRTPFCYKYVYRGIYGGCRISPDIKSQKRRIPWMTRREKTLRFLTQMKEHS